MPAGASPLGLARSGPARPARCGARAARGRTRASSTRRSRRQHGGVGRVGPSLASHRTIAHGLGKRLSRAAGFGKALHDRFSVPRGGVPERDPTVETYSIKRSGRRIALCPQRIGQVLLWCVRDGARRQEQGEPEDRSQTLEELASLVEHGAHKAVRRIRAIATIEPVVIPEISRCDQPFILTS